MTTSAAGIEAVWETKLPLPLVGRGKVRDIYAVGRDRLLIVTTDRLSAFDVVLPDPIPFKGKVLTQISVFWFDVLKSIVPNHLITAELGEMNLPAEVKEKSGALLEGRAMLVRRAQPLPVECVIRGYLTGSGWKDYLKTGATSGHKLPAGLQQCQKLPKPLFTPATKAVTGHDENISFEETVSRIGEGTAKKVEALSLGLYERGRDYAETKGILIADTKFEFGLIKNEIILIDEALTPDSSRFWPKAGYGPGRDQPSFDKQIVRNYLLTLTWNQKPPGPKLPPEIIEKTSRAYREIYRRLVGKEIV